jgi:methylated-DNA-protein-cysteine methyltransferase-like protein
MGVRNEIQEAVRALPPGGVVGYGDVARACGTVAVLVGKVLAVCGEGVPWQRVIGSDGTLRTARRGSLCAARQRALLEAEGVTFDAEGRVPSDEPAWERGRVALAGWARGPAQGKTPAPTNGAVSAAGRDRLPARGHRSVPTDGANTME